MTVRSILTRLPSARRAQARTPARPTDVVDPSEEDLNIALEVLRRENDRLVMDLESATGEARAARAQLETTRAGLQGRLEQALAAEAQVRASLAAEQALREGLVAQLTGEREARRALQAPLEQAIAAAAKPPLIVPAASSPPVSYELDMTNRDLNGRTRRIVLKPIIEKAG